MARKGENIYQRKDGRWEGRYMKGRADNGKAVYGYVYALSYKEVKRKRNEAIAKVDPKQLEKRILLTKDISVKDISEQWLNSLQPLIKKSTYCKYYNLLYKHILPELGKKKINTISASQLQLFCDQLLMGNSNSNSKPLSPKTVSDVLSIIRRILNYAKIHEYCPICTGMEVVVRTSSPDIVILSVSAQKNLCKYLSEHPTKQNLGILICLFTGIRIGDADDKIRLNQRKPSKYKGLRRFGPEKNSQRSNQFMKERPIFYKNLIQMKDNFRYYLRCFYCITKVVILQFNKENRTELAHSG